MKPTRSYRRVHKAQGPPYNRVVDLLDLTLWNIGPLGPIDLLDLLDLLWRGWVYKLEHLWEFCFRVRAQGKRVTHCER